MIPPRVGLPADDGSLRSHRLGAALPGSPWREKLFAASPLCCFAVSLAGAFQLRDLVRRHARRSGCGCCCVVELKIWKLAQRRHTTRVRVLPAHVAQLLLPDRIKAAVTDRSARFLGAPDPSRSADLELRSGKDSGSELSPPSLCGPTSPSSSEESRGDFTRQNLGPPSTI